MLENVERNGRRCNPMRTIIAIGDPGRLRCADMAVRNKILLGVEILGDLRNIVFGGSSDLPHGFDAAFAKLL